MSLTDLTQLARVQATLQEDAAFSNGLWSLAEVVGYFNQRQARFLFETQILAGTLTLGWIPGVPQQPLPDDWIVTIAAAWHDLATDQWTPLPRSDTFEMDHLLSPTAAVTVGLPQAYRDLDTTETLALAVDPVPAAAGELSLIYVPLAEVLDGLGTLFGVPDDWVPYLTYGVYADMLGKDGRGQDLLRARYAEQRYQEGLVLAQSLLGGY